MAADENVPKPGEQIKAMLSAQQAKDLVELRYGFTVWMVQPLVAYDDKNYFIRYKESEGHDNPHIATLAKDGYVEKIVNKLDSRDTGFIEAQNEILRFLAGKGFNCPVPVAQKDGSYYSIETIGKTDPQKHVLRLLTYLPGEMLDNVPISDNLLRSIGTFAAKLDKNLEDFKHPEYEKRTSLWALTSLPKLRDYTYALENSQDISLIEEIVQQFELKVLSIVKELAKGIIHGDLNEHNILVNKEGSEIVAILDFGDSHKNCYVFELAICLCYMICKSESVEMARHVIEGYQEVRKLTRREREILKLCVCARMAQSLVMGTYTHTLEPDNPYLIDSHEVKWRMLRRIWSMDDDELMTLWGING